MNQKDNLDLTIDLVFKFCQNKNLIKSFNNEDSLIFELSFWEEVFLSWINTIILENHSSFPDLIFNKKFFSLSFEIVDNKKISELNQKWLKKSVATDVLSFPIIFEQEGVKDFNFLELGDLFISLEMAYKQSEHYKHSLKFEMLWLASHGFLHLLGWEHKNKKQLDNMLNFQEYLISKLK